MSRQLVLALYKSLVTESKKFPSYNYRNYALRKVRSEFRRNRHQSEPARIEELLQSGRENLEMIKRQVTVGRLYSSEKLVIENN